MPNKSAIIYQNANFRGVGPRGVVAVVNSLRVPVRLLVANEGCSNSNNVEMVCNVEMNDSSYNVSSKIHLLVHLNAERIRFPDQVLGICPFARLKSQTNG